MNKYCYKFSHNFVIPNKEEIFSGSPKIHSTLDKNILDKELHRYLKEIDIEIRWVEVHYKIPLPASLKQSIYGSIHADGSEIDDKAKINFIIGGTESSMIWWKLKNNQMMLQDTVIDTTCVRPKSLDDVEEVYRESFQSAIVNVGQIHSIENTKDERIAIECILQDIFTKNRLDFFEAVRRFKFIENNIN